MSDEIRQALGSIRFGYGLSAADRGTDRTRLLAQVQDKARSQSVDGMARFKLMRQFQKLNRNMRQGKGDEAQVKAKRRKIQTIRSTDVIDMILAPAVAKSPFAERLTSFWANHFTVAASSRTIALLAPDLRENVIRPAIGGRFADMLFGVMTHPAMLLYLDQIASVGPNSRVGKKRGKGLNENLSRELLELHTVGADGGYAQRDVRELAELLTGLRVTGDGFMFDRHWAEPGAETVLGATFGGAERASLDDIRAALDHLARLPQTAQFIAHKLARHFVADAPSEALVAHIAAAYRAGGGALMPVYEALLEHPDAWDQRLQKVKPPIDYMISTARVMQVTSLPDRSPKFVRGAIFDPLVAMGQEPLRPPGPDGWPEEGAVWVTPATLTARIDWAADVARNLAQDLDPRAFVERALGPLARDDVRFAANAAESKWEGVALVLVSPEFNRR